MTDVLYTLGRGARDAIEEEDGAVFMTEQDDDDEHVKLLNPVKVQSVVAVAIWPDTMLSVTIALGCV